MKMHTCKRQSIFISRIWAKCPHFTSSAYLYLKNCRTFCESNEEWRDIKDYSKYEISTAGKIRNKSTMSILKARKPPNGEVVILKRDDGVRKSQSVNRLVLSTFRPHPNMANMFATRKDGNPHNNMLSNLEWLTRSELAKKTIERTGLYLGVPVFLTKLENGIEIETVQCQSITKCFELINQFFNQELSRKTCNMRGGVEFSDPDQSSAKKCIVKYCDPNKNSTTVVDLDENEVWKLYGIGNKKQHYYVSNYGRVKACYPIRKTQKLLRQHAIDGYTRVVLYIGGKPKGYMVHNLVADLFVWNPHNYDQVDHIDTKRDNNRYTNLRFVEGPSANAKNSATLAKKINPKQVLQIDPLTNRTVCTWKNAYTAGKELNFQSSNILNCCRIKRKTCGGFKWKFKE